MKTKLLRKLRRKANRVIRIDDSCGRLSIIYREYMGLEIEFLQPITTMGERPMVSWESEEQLIHDVVVYRREFIIEEISKERLRKKVKQLNSDIKF